MNYETARLSGQASLIQPYPRRLIKICSAGLLTFDCEHFAQSHFTVARQLRILTGFPIIPVLTGTPKQS